MSRFEVYPTAGPTRYRWRLVADDAEIVDLTGEKDLMAALRASLERAKAERVAKPATAGREHTCHDEFGEDGCIACADERNTAPPREPRVWAMQTIPADVQRVVDPHGMVWKPIRDEHGPTLGFIQLWCYVDRALTHVHLSEQELIVRGPLTEVVDPPTSTPSILNGDMPTSFFNPRTGQWEPIDG